MAKHLGVTEDVIQSSLDDLVLTDMRMQRIETDQYGLLINDAYNASPTSMKAAIDTLHNMEQSDKTLILADVLELGEMSQEMHEQVGYYLEHKAIQTLITYGEEAAHISNIAKAYIPETYHFEHKEEITDYLKNQLNEDSITLFKGSRGMSLKRLLTRLHESRYLVFTWLYRWSL